ncbi:agmatine coumaroyltransferase-1-like [Brachypodium distachyon]|uniref:Agmatine coumaroyltransferase-2 n=1 Tax=Brachypodium distachyon TaxID=15368 RepID=I1J311_BRADI|nr:agmatine coumaroyltransferase-1-like [Brachypodium distachyon]PNT62080.1 hypothetical protein BRADI_5g25166v3 [Brachypodium distachyon]|eukprot:XP_003580760.1 agmatine coumaroyltransferase-1-like [Brachypodium distachyon]
MKITVHSSKAVKPDYGSRPAPGTDEVIPLTVLDKANFDCYISVIYAFHPPSPPNTTLEAGLAKCLAEYREWAGRLTLAPGAHGRGIVLNDAGARFVEATADVALDSVMPLEPTPDVLALHPCVGEEDEPEPELMLIQVTRFACGSITVGFTTQHIVSDGRATGNFFVAWSQATRGVPLDPVPVHDRASFFSPSSTLVPKVQHQHRGVDFKPANLDNGDNGTAVREDDEDEVVVSKVHFSRDFISKLKSEASASAGHHQRPYSTLQCLVAHLWRRITKARGLLPHEPTSVSIAVDGRARIHTPRQIPEGYTGNVVLWARPTCTAQDLVESRPLGHAVELINKAVSRIDDGYFRSFVDFAGSGAVEKERLVPAADAKEMVLSPNIEVDSWLRMPFYDVDFGAGRPFFFMPSYLPVEGLLILLPSFLGDGSVDAYVPLFGRHVDTFKNSCHTLE